MYYKSLCLDKMVQFQFKNVEDKCYIRHNFVSVAIILLNKYN